MNGSPKRRNWTKSLTIAVIVASVATIVGCVINSSSSNTDRIYLISSAGNLLFDHGKHNKTAESCAQCHHNLYGAAFVASCEDCHDDGVEADDFDHAELKSMHERDCSKCHEQDASDDQAVSCRTCHLPVQENTDEISCSECHEDYTPDIMDHDEYLEVEDHSCLTCHTPSIVSEAYHTDCNRCHLEKAPKRFADNAGKAVCGACHLR